MHATPEVSFSPPHMRNDMHQHDTGRDPGRDPDSKQSGKGSEMSCGFPRLLSISRVGSACDPDNVPSRTIEGPNRTWLFAEPQRRAPRPSFIVVVAGIAGGKPVGDAMGISTVVRDYELSLGTSTA
ncbi:hypothetical protein M430DRAFT_29239 [Amorphotheca resinae ATCC 22711]|uniref:Uncharacterized protein n=1 Tax=Amorphotheca resinae ATCC 22711 TaxID=857342 RepID=A0A2T3AYY6_AMORE|nr:hypothetical protein M430DRAFT_29239 [Amorphotheca resinae ATCC 22711]PSS15251.1 hypothetical protein M430DRAFT_29239 [Amorphotheca resinae ATCC 22711]